MKKIIIYDIITIIVLFIVLSISKIIIFNTVDPCDNKNSFCLRDSLDNIVKKILIFFIIIWIIKLLVNLYKYLKIKKIW